MKTHIGKDVLLFWRNRKEVATLVLLPILLIVVLNFGLSGLFGGSSAPEVDNLTLAIVNEDGDRAGAETLFAQLTHPDLARWLTVERLDGAEARRQVEQGQIDAALIVPQGYTHRLEHAAAVRHEPPVELSFIVQEATVNTGAIQEILRESFDGMQFRLALQQATGMVPDAAGIQPVGGVERIDGAEPFTMGQYFTIGIGTLFALFLASSVAERTAAEKREQVFRRIVISRARPFDFLMGKVFAAFCLILLQISFVVLVAQLMLRVFAGRDAAFWLGFVLVLATFALALAGLSALYTVMALRIRQMETANGLFLLITMGFGLLGGGFVPLTMFPEWMQQIGRWTPNGMTLTALIEWIQYGSMSSLTLPVIALLLVAAAGLLAGIVFFPKRGEV